MSGPNLHRPAVVVVVVVIADQLSSSDTILVQITSRARERLSERYSEPKALLHPARHVSVQMLLNQ